MEYDDNKNTGNGDDGSNVKKEEGSVRSWEGAAAPTLDLKFAFLP